MPDDLLDRLRRFRLETFPAQQARFEDLVVHGQQPTTLFIGCSDSRIVPHLLTGAGPGELFMVRNVGAFVPPYDGYLYDPLDDELGDPVHSPDGPSGIVSKPGSRAQPGTTRRWVGYHGTAAAIEFAVLTLNIARIVVCGHNHCGGIRALYGDLPPSARHLAAWLQLGREAILPVVEPSHEELRRTEQRAIVLQLERLMGYPMVREHVDANALTLHGWHYVIEHGDVHVFDVRSGRFVAASRTEDDVRGAHEAVEQPDEGSFLAPPAAGPRPCAPGVARRRPGGYTG